LALLQTKPCAGMVPNQARLSGTGVEVRKTLPNWMERYSENFGTRRTVRIRLFVCRAPGTNKPWLPDQGEEKWARQDSNRKLNAVQPLTGCEPQFAVSNGRTYGAQVTGDFITDTVEAA
jgi:hypothetical protein